MSMIAKTEGGRRAWKILRSEMPTATSYRLGRQRVSMQLGLRYISQSFNPTELPAAETSFASTIVRHLTRRAQQRSSPVTSVSLGI